MMRHARSESMKPLAKTKYPWHREGTHRLDLVLMGEPDCHAYIVKYRAVEHFGCYGHAYCWILTMPRASGRRQGGWAHTWHQAKREVEADIRDGWL